MIAAEDAPAVNGVGAYAWEMADFPCYALVVFGNGFVVGGDVFAVVAAGVV